MSSMKSSLDDLLGESWVDVGPGNTTQSSQQTGTGTPASTTGSVNHQLTVDDYLRLLREAQRESNQSSARVSLAGSRRDTPRDSPKSPPNSPVQGSTPLHIEWQYYYMNSETKDDAEFLTDWSSRPDQLPPKNWTFRPPKTNICFRYARVGDTTVFSRRGFYTLFLTNLISLILGTGVGLWLSKYGFFVPSVKVR